MRPSPHTRAPRRRDGSPSGTKIAEPSAQRTRKVSEPVSTSKRSSLYSTRDLSTSKSSEVVQPLDANLPRERPIKSRTYKSETRKALPLREPPREPLARNDVDREGASATSHQENVLRDAQETNVPAYPPVPAPETHYSAFLTTDLPKQEPRHARLLERSSKSIARTKLVVSLDFGTTFSGASYALIHPDDDAEDVKIIPISNWPAELPGDTDSKKVPSQIAYGQDENRTQYWGFDIPESLNYVTVRWFKLLLEPERPSTIRSFTDVIDPDFTSELLEVLKTDAVTVASDYVRLLWQHVKEQIINQHDQATFDYAQKSIVMTVPSVWSDRAKHNTYLVAVNAGLADDDYELNIVAEPEAAAVSVLKDRNRTIMVGDVYVIVDAGGGTVDITTYAVKSIQPLILEEVIPGDGDICGAAFLTFNFRKLLRTYLGDDVLTKLMTDEPESEARIIRDFEDGVRKKFDGTDTRKMNVAVTGISDTAAPNIKGGLMRFTAAELNPVFLPVLEKVERLIRRQVKALKRLNQTPKAILLVGGFGTNFYMLKRLQHLYSNGDTMMDKKSTVTVSQPSNGWQSIANGAVLCEVLGLGSLLPLRIARYNVGILCDRPYDPAIHKPEQMFVHEVTGQSRARHNFFWFLRRGDSLRTGHSVDFQASTPISEEEMQSDITPTADDDRKTKYPIQIHLVTSLEDDAPTNHPTKHTRLFVSCVIHWDLTEVAKSIGPLREASDGTQYRHISWTIHMQRGLDGMNFSYSLFGKYIGPVTQVDFHSLDDLSNRIHY